MLSLEDLLLLSFNWLWKEPVGIVSPSGSQHADRHQLHQQTKSSNWDEQKLPKASHTDNTKEKN